MLYYLAAVIYVLACFVLIGVILLQQGKGGDMASAFGGGSSQAAFGARTGATVLTRATTVLAALFLVGALLLNVLAHRGPSSVIGGRTQPGAPAAPARTAPAPKLPTGNASKPVQAAPTAPPAPAAPAAPAPKPQEPATKP